ncbi:MAG TPA: hypothetical protein VK171_09490 [Fimbriimonas sp.]|nr:hypothetical protein [Fimbriimonas sp.]
MLTSLLILGIQGKLLPVGTIASDLVPEMSGIVKSEKFPNTYWVHNDSGDEPRFFAINKRGGLIQPTQSNYAGIRVEGAKAQDWEDIAYDKKFVYLADVGDNPNLRSEVVIYRVKEPNPLKETSVKIESTIRIQYPDKVAGGPMYHDCEAVAVRGDVIYMVSKWREKGGIPGQGASLYRLKKWKKDKVNVLEKLDTKTDLGGWVTAADISPDGSKLAVLTQAPSQSVWVFDLKKGGKAFSNVVKHVKFTGGLQCEAICWNESNEVLVGNEQRQLYSLSL